MAPASGLIFYYLKEVQRLQISSHNTGWHACRLIVNPIVSFAARAHAAEERRRLAEQIAEARQHALRQQAVMGARVARLAAADSDKTGFHVIKVRCLHLSACMPQLSRPCFGCLNLVGNR